MNRAIEQQQRKTSQRRCQRRGEHCAVAVYILQRVFEVCLCACRLEGRSRRKEDDTG